MRKVFSLAAGLVGVALAAAVAGPANAIIKGGTRATEAGPNVVMEMSGISDRCSGTLLNSQWVLTARWCVETRPLGKVVWGRVGRGVEGKAVTYTKMAFEDGLALVRLDQKLPDGAVKLPSLGDADPQVGATVQFFGYGLTDDPKRETTAELRFGFATVVAPAANGRADGFGGPSWTTLSNGNGISTWEDWGGGAYLDEKLVGVAVSANGEDGTTFASIDKHRKWIDQTISNAPIPTPPS